MKIQPYVDSWVSETQKRTPPTQHVYCYSVSPFPNVCLEISTLLPQ